MYIVIIQQIKIWSPTTIDLGLNLTVTHSIHDTHRNGSVDTSLDHLFFQFLLKLP